MRYIKIFSDAADKIEIKRDVPTGETDDFDSALANFRKNGVNNKGSNQENPGAKDIVKLINRSFQLVIVPGPGSKREMVPLRKLKSGKIGSLVQTKGLVVRVSDVKPLISVACYICEICGFELYQQVHGKNYNPIVECVSTICRSNGSRGRIIPNNAVSKFEPYQEIKIQETSDQTPMGSIPRSFVVSARGNLTRKCVPGDIVSIMGVYLPKPADRFRAFSDSLVHDTYIESFKIDQEKKRYFNSNLPDQQLDEILKLGREENIYQKVKVL